MLQSDKGSLLVCKLLLGGMGDVYKALRVVGTWLMLTLCDEECMLASTVFLECVGCKRCGLRYVCLNVWVQKLPFEQRLLGTCCQSVGQL